jgi:hypothetical protein
MDYRPHLLPKVRSRGLLDVAGYPCTLRVSSFIPGHSCAHVSTVVACHLNTPAKGVSTKSSDIASAAGCAHCHDLLDGRDARVEWIISQYPTAFQNRLVQALIETWTLHIMNGRIVIPDGEIA